MYRIASPPKDEKVRIYKHSRMGKAEIDNVQFVLLKILPRENAGSGKGERPGWTA